MIVVVVVVVDQSGESKPVSLCMERKQREGERGGRKGYLAVAVDMQFHDIGLSKATHTEEG